MQSEPLTKSLQTTSTMISKEWRRHTSHLRVTTISVSIHVALSLVVQQLGTMCSGHVPFAEGIPMRSPHRWHSWMPISPPVKTSRWLRSRSTRSLTKNRREERSRSPAQTQASAGNQGAYRDPNAASSSAGPTQTTGTGHTRAADDRRAAAKVKVVIEGIQALRSEPEQKEEKRSCSSTHFSPSCTKSQVCIQDLSYQSSCRSTTCTKSVSKFTISIQLEARF